MITGPQITAARKLLGWSILDLSRHAGMEIADVQDTEASVGSPKRHLTNLTVIRRALEDAGIKSIDSVGVQFAPQAIANPRNLKTQKFHLGQDVGVQPPRGTYVFLGAWIVTAKLPERDGEFEYRIRSALEDHDR